MSDFTIEQLEALKEGTPDSLHRYSMDFRGERSHSVKSGSGMVRAHTGYGPDGGTAYKDAELFAAAPALVDALIAEKQAHQKLRDEVEKVRDRKHALSKVQYQTARDLKNGIFDETFGTMPETHTVEAWEMGARANQRTATALTRILEATDG